MRYAHDSLPWCTVPFKRMGKRKSKVSDLSYFKTTHDSNLGTVCRPRNREELFNLRHASARNVVERIFGVYKREFAVFKTAPEYPMDIQAMLVPALSAIHNYVGIHDPDSHRNLEFQIEACSASNNSNSSQEPATPQVQISEQELGLNITQEERQQAAHRRDMIAEKMWVDYLAELERRKQ